MLMETSRRQASDTKESMRGQVGRQKLFFMNIENDNIDPQNELREQWW
jgi:hypothetical protein